MQKSFVAFFAILLILLLLTVTNPSSNQFVSYLSEKFSADSVEEYEETDVVIATGIKEIPLVEIMMFVERDNYILFSYHYLSLPSGEYKYLGILGNFSLLKHKE